MATAIQPQQLIQQLRDYLQGAQAEARKVVWPGRQYVLAATTIVLFIVFVIVVFVMGVDLVFAQLFKLLGQIFG